MRESLEAEVAALTVSQRAYFNVLSATMAARPGRIEFQRSLPGAEALHRLGWPVHPGMMPWVLHYAAGGAVAHAASFDDEGSSIEELEHVASWSIDLQYAVLEGQCPVIQLTPAQQMALWLSEPDLENISNDVPTERSFDWGAVVVLAEPIIPEGDYMPLVALCVRYDAENGVVLHPIFRDESTYAMTSVSPTHVATNHEWLDPDVRDAGRFALLVSQVLPMFGLTAATPAGLAPRRREQRRRAERLIAKRRADFSQVSIRYIRDRSGKIAVQHISGDGRHVRPHLRRGHVRHVRTGSMSLPLEQRPTVRKFIPPTIVNGHLGDPSEIVVYRDRTRA
jgi:hypothetical protein